MIEEETSRNTERRVLGLIPASAIVISNMIGTGIFTTTGLMVEMGVGGGDILVGWLLGGIIALCGALCYGEIGANLPASGGEYYYLSRLLHPSLGFLSGCVSLTVGFAAPIAAAAIAMHLYLGRVIANWPVRAMAVATILILALLHAYDLRLGSKVQALLIGVKVLLLLAFASSILLKKTGGAETAIASFDPSVWASPSFTVALIFVSFAYSGWNAAAYVGAEIHKPDRTLPWALLLGTGAVTLIYLLVNFSYLSAIPLSQLSGVEEVAHEVGEVLWGTLAVSIISTLIALTQVCPIGAMIMIGPRVIEAMGKDGLLPSVFSRLNRKNVPALAVWLQAALAALFASTFSFAPLLIYIGFTLNIFAALTVFSLFRLRRERRSAHKICIGYPVTPLIFIAFALWISIWSIRSQPMAALAGAATLSLGYVAYVLRSKSSGQ